MAGSEGWIMYLILTKTAQRAGTTTSSLSEHSVSVYKPLIYRVKTLLSPTEMHNTAVAASNYCDSYLLGHNVDAEEMTIALVKAKITFPIFK